MPSNDDSTTTTAPEGAADATRTRTRSRSRTTASPAPEAAAEAATKPVKKAAKKAAKKTAKKAVTKAPTKRTAKRTSADAADGAGDAGTAEGAPAKRAPAKKAAAKKVPAKRTVAGKATTREATAEQAADAAALRKAEDRMAGESPAVVPSEDGPAKRVTTRTRAPRAARAAQGTDDVGATGDGAAESAESAADGGGTEEDARPNGARRRRGGRGRRGRGRRGSGPAGETGADEDEVSRDADDDGEADADAGTGARDGAPGGGRRSARKKTSSRSGGGDGDGPRIVRGGTRLAAKKARRSSGGSSSSGSGGARRRERPGGVTEEERRAILAGPPRTMLVTAKPERTQIAVLEDRSLVEHYVTRDEDVTFVGNIYLGRVQNVLPGMEAAFLDIGKGRNGVLYAGEVLYDEQDLEEESDQRIEKVLKPGQKVLVQVTKDPMGTKGPRLTMHLSLAGRYVVLAPNSTLFGISRKLTDEERDRLRRIVKAAKPDGHGVIVRTAAEGATEEQLTADVERLVARWDKVEAAAKRAKPLEAVYEEPKLVVKVIRDIFGPDFVRCIIDDETLFDQVRDYLDEVAPELLDRIELYGAPTDDERSQAAGVPSLADGAAEAAAADASGGVATAPTAEDRRKALPALFQAFDVTDQLRQAMHRKVWLPSGGYLIVESTEAMKVIDVNTGRFTGGSDSNLEEVVLKTNLEAAEEIVRQLRLRDMGGMIIIDFIDMLLRSNQDQVVRRLKRELLRDRTKTRVSDVSRLGLVQMTRKNVSQGLVESFSSTCEACEGHGFLTDLS
jgi:Rne/Rng family ribonuclease